ncbi:MAG: hypothetical protein P8Y36_03835, partial [Alphaproteobacteria bacterium]
MSNEQPRPPQRFSRFSRRDLMPVSQPDEPSLEEITTRALQEEQSASSHTARRDMPHNPQSLPSAQQAQWSASVPHSQQSPSQ